MSKFGISVAMLSPFDGAGALDAERLGANAARLLKEGADGVTLFGTTGEGSSIGASERSKGLKALSDAGVPAERITLCIYANAVEDGLAQIAEGRAAGVRTFLVPPPFYFPAPSDDGLYAWFSALIADADPEARFIVYHIPQVTGVSISAALMKRLLDRFGDRIRAVKDSSGNWETAQSFLAIEGLSVLVGDERLLHRAVALGGAGSITGCANLYPARLKRIFETGQEDADLSAIITKIVSKPVIPALKVLMADASGDTGWNRVRAPLTPLEEADAQDLLAATVPGAVDG